MKFPKINGLLNRYRKDLKDELPNRSTNMQTCNTCKHLDKNNVCTKLNDLIYPDYRVLDDSGFYVNGYDIERPNEFGCNKHTLIKSHRGVT